MPDTPGQEGAEGHALNPTEIRVLSVGKSLKIEPFKIPENPLEVGRAWREWIEDFEDETSYFEITKIRDRVNALNLARNLPETAPVVGDDDYKKLKRKLNNYSYQKRASITPDTRLTSKNKSQERVLSHTRRDCAKNQRIASSASKQMTEYWNTWYKPSRTASSLKEAFRRNGTSINFLRKQAKKKISISKSKI